MDDESDLDRDSSAAGTSSGARAGRDAEPPDGGRGGDSDVPRPPMPRWVRWSGTFALVLVVLLILLRVIGGGEHGPGRHASIGTGLDGTSTPAAPLAGVARSAPGMPVADRAAEVKVSGRG